MANKILDEVVELLSKCLNIEKDIIQLSSRIMEDLGADSLEVIELVMAFEDKFKINIPDEDIETLLTVEDIVKYLVSKKNET